MHKNKRHRFVRVQVGVWIERTDVVGPDACIALYTDKDEHELLVTRRQGWVVVGGVGAGEFRTQNHNKNYGQHSLLLKTHYRLALAQVRNQLETEDSLLTSNSVVANT